MAPFLVDVPAGWRARFRRERLPGGCRRLPGEVASECAARRGGRAGHAGERSARRTRRGLTAACERLEAPRRRRIREPPDARLPPAARWFSADVQAMPVASAAAPPLAAGPGRVLMPRLRSRARRPSWRPDREAWPHGLPLRVSQPAVPVRSLARQAGRRDAGRICPDKLGQRPGSTGRIQRHAGMGLSGGVLVGTDGGAGGGGHARYRAQHRAAGCVGRGGRLRRRPPAAWPARPRRLPDGPWPVPSIGIRPRFAVLRCLFSRCGRPTRTAACRRT